MNAMKKCIVISDSFKGTLSSRDICQIAREAISSVFPACEADCIPVADGGEGTVACFEEAIGAVPISVSVRGPYGEPVQAIYGRRDDRAIVEMAAAAGLPMVGERKNPGQTTTYGVGQLIRHAVEHGCRSVLLGLGGSATIDGGCGAAAALGTRFYRQDGSQFIPLGDTLDQIARIDVSETRRLLEAVTITAMCDVENPLCGPQGAAFIFGPQKGADEAMVRRLDRQLRAFGAVLARQLGFDPAHMAGAGAAGGMGAGCAAFFGAELCSGIEAVLDMVEFDRRLEGAGLVITGEGRMDSQSLHGKVISGVAGRTRPRGIPLVAIVGCIGENAAAAYELGVTAMFSINREAESLAQSGPKSALHYRETLEDVLRLIRGIAPL